MISPSLHDALGRAARATWLIWGGFVASVPVYLAVGWLVSRGLARNVSAPPFLPAVLGALAAAQLAAALLLPRVWLRDDVLRRVPATPSPVPAALTPRERRVLDVHVYAQGRLVAAWALCEGPAVLGLVLAVLGYGPALALPFAVAALAGLLWLRPRPFALAERADALLPRA